jgi:hypothetical protein
MQAIFMRAYQYLIYGREVLGLLKVLALRGPKIGSVKRGGAPLSVGEAPWSLQQRVPNYVLGASFSEPSIRSSSSSSSSSSSGSSSY